MDALVSFPAAIFSILLGIVLLYWLLVILGALDVDLPFTELDGNALFGNLPGLAGLGSVPLPISVSLVVLGSWGWAVLGTHWLVVPGAWGYLAGALVFLVALLLGVLMAAAVLYPLRGVFVVPARGPAQLIGKPCRITSGEVNEDFGQGVYSESGRELILNLRARVPNTLARGGEALIVAYDAEQRAYLVISHDELLD